MIETESKQKYVDIQPKPFHNDDPINSQLYNTVKIYVAFQTTYPLHYVVYPISEANLSTPFDLLVRFKQDK